MRDSFTESFRESRTEGSRQEHGAWIRDQGTRDVGPKAPSIVKVSSARARDAWMGLRP
jgi:hypothetical protein